MEAPEVLNRCIVHSTAMLSKPTLEVGAFFFYHKKLELWKNGRCGLRFLIEGNHQYHQYHIIGIPLVLSGMILVKIEFNN